MENLILAACAALALSGCLTGEEMAAQQAELKAQVASADDSECRSYGAEQGTPVYVECRMIKDQQRAQETAAAQAERSREFKCHFAQMMSGFRQLPEFLQRSGRSPPAEKMATDLPAKRLPRTVSKHPRAR